ncbi:MAG: PAS domain-containing protein [Kiritimatiellae bacterium]|nr:PAS domain-containing protein [Kiritimatiellia bacterium]
MKSAFLDKLLDKIDKIDAGSLQSHFLRLAGEKGLLETIFHAIQEGIVVVDGRGCLTYANRASESMLGFELDAAVGHPLSKYLRGIEWEKVQGLDETEWSKLLTREIEICNPTHRYVDFYVVPLRAVEADEEGAVVILRDVTRERMHETRTIQSERLNAITLLAAGVAHEIGNPLNSLTIHLQLMMRELGDCPPDVQASLGELLDVAQREVTRLDQIITQFLKALRPTQPAFERASLREVVDDTLQFLHHELRDRDILVEIDTAEDLPAALIDRNQIKQAFFNIIRNAMQVMPGGGLLKIWLGANDRFVYVAFKDNGPGIPADELSSIFEAYYTTKLEGTGLGLMIVQRIIRDHGGELEVHSEPQSGTTFTLYLPRDENRIRLLKAPRASRPDEPEGSPS